jgi:hypothetical protein
MAKMNEETLAELLKNPKELADTIRKAKIAAEILQRSGRAGAGAGAAYRSGTE